jgi:hypothetical protein
LVHKLVSLKKELHAVLHPRNTSLDLVPIKPPARALGCPRKNSLSFSKGTAADLFPGRINRDAFEPLACRVFGGRADRANRSDDFPTVQKGCFLLPRRPSFDAGGNTFRLTPRDQPFWKERKRQLENASSPLRLGSDNRGQSSENTGSVPAAKNQNPSFDGYAPRDGALANRWSSIRKGK